LLSLAYFGRDFCQALAHFIGGFLPNLAYFSRDFCQALAHLIGGFLPNLAPLQHPLAMRKEIGTWVAV